MSDISSVLAEWPYDPERTVRMICAEDGRTVLQVRLPLGIEQYELDGRPDGLRPFGRGTMLEEVESRLESFVRDGGHALDFEIDHETFLMLQNEGILFYYRYLMLLQLNDHDRVAKDTAHNLRICELVETHVRSAEDRVALLQYRPYIIRVNAIANAMLLLRSGRKRESLDVLNRAVEAIRSLAEMDSSTFQFERVRSINFLKSAIQQTADHHPQPADILQAELNRALEEENYERAAELRDRLNELHS